MSSINLARATMSARSNWLESSTLSRKSSLISNKEKKKKWTEGKKIVLPERRQLIEEMQECHQDKSTLTGMAKNSKLLTRKLFEDELTEEIFKKLESYG